MLLKSNATAELISRLFSNLNDFESGKLRVGKIILAADPDIDGLHINNLFHAFLWNVVPQAYEEGRVLVADVPLYKATLKQTVVYGYSVEDVDEQLRAKTRNIKARTISRFKGLGEMNPKEIYSFILNPDTRKLLRYTASG